MTARTCHRPGCWAPATTTEITEANGQRMVRGVCRPGSCASLELATVSTVPEPPPTSALGRASGAIGGRARGPGRVVPGSSLHTLLCAMVAGDGVLSSVEAGRLLGVDPTRASSKVGHLTYRGLAERVRRGVYRITDEGRRVVAESRGRA